MTLRSPLAMVALLVVGGGVLLLLMGWGGTLGIPDLFVPFLLAGGAIFPFVAAFVLGREALRVPARRAPLAVLLFVSAAGAAGLAWWLRGGTMHVLLTILAATVVGGLGMGALVAAWAYRPGDPWREWLEVASRHLWMAVLGGAVLYLSLPPGMVLLRRDASAAKAWVERAAAAVRAEAASRGGPPANIVGLFPRLGPPPRHVPEDGGYHVSNDGTSFTFRIDDPTQFLPGEWVYEGKTGTWRQARF